jgi:hypothetical protein
MPMAGPRWLPLLLVAGLPLGACGAERPGDSVATTAAVVGASPQPPPAAPAQARQVIPGPDVTLMPDGTAVLAPPVGDVAMLQRMPDGTFRRVCGPPQADMRAMIEAKRRARRGGK